MTLIVTTSSCSGQKQINPVVINTSMPKDSARVAKPVITQPKKQSSYYDMKFDTTQVSQYIRRIFQDRKGNLWFGTVGDGVCRYEYTTGKLTYFSTKEGFGGVSVQGITEDKEGNLWFGTSGGVTKYDGTHFINFTEKEGLLSNHVFSVLIDRTGTLWAGTNEGVCRYNTLAAIKLGSKAFTSFSIPEPFEKDLARETSPKIIWNMIEDKSSSIWFATNGGGFYNYNPTSGELTNLSKKDGLASNFANCIVQDTKENLWFATQGMGVSRYNLSTTLMKGLTHFTDKESLGGIAPLTMLEDKAGSLWFAARGGVYRYDPSAITTGAKAFTIFNALDGLTNTGVQSIYQDKSGTLWFGTGAGLFRFDGKSKFINVTKNGPWW